MTSFKTIALAAASLALTAPFAPTAFAGGETGTHGGNLIKLRDRNLADRTARIAELLRAELKPMLIGYFQNRRAFKPRYPGPEVAAMFEGLLRADTDRLVRDAVYDIQTARPCLDQWRDKVPMSAKPGDPRAAICINPRMLAELDATVPEIFGLMVHEHAHQLGAEYEDRDHALADFVRQDAAGYVPLIRGARLRSQNRFDQFDSTATPPLPVFIPSLRPLTIRLQLPEAPAASGPIRLDIARLQCSSGTFWYHSNPDGSWIMDRHVFAPDHLAMENIDPLDVIARNFSFAFETPGLQLQIEQDGRTVYRGPANPAPGHLGLILYPESLQLPL